MRTIRHLLFVALIITMLVMPTAVSAASNPPVKTSGSYTWHVILDKCHTSDGTYSYKLVDHKNTGGVDKYAFTSEGWGQIVNTCDNGRVIYEYTYSNRFSAVFKSGVLTIENANYTGHSVDSNGHPYEYKTRVHYVDGTFRINAWINGKRVQ